MIITLKPITITLRLPQLQFAPRRTGERRRRHAAMDLVNSSPHLKRDIGLLEEHFIMRHS